MIFALKRYWADRGCIIQEPYDVEVGRRHHVSRNISARSWPQTISRGLCSASRRPADGRYGQNPNRLYKHQQLQVILKPTPDDVIDQYLGSLTAIGIDLSKHDIKLEEDNWESPTLGAWGIGWQVMLDGQEITQFTYFQQCGGLDLELCPAEIDLRNGTARRRFCRASKACTTSSGRPVQVFGCSHGRRSPVFGLQL
jgi:glycyl-tRNA synthetase alpha chain